MRYHEEDWAINCTDGAGIVITDGTGLAVDGTGYASEEDWGIN